MPSSREVCYHLLSSRLQTISGLRVSSIFICRLLAFNSVSNVYEKYDLRVHLYINSYELG